MSLSHKRQIDNNLPNDPECKVIRLYDLNKEKGSIVFFLKKPKKKSPFNIEIYMQMFIVLRTTQYFLFGRKKNDKKKPFNT